MQNKIIKWAIPMLLIVGILCYYGSKIKRQKQEYSTAIANIKAYDLLLLEKEDHNRALQLTVEQLGSLRDSLLNQMDSVRKELKVKDKNLKAIHYMSSRASRTDTIEFRDTIFKDNKVNIDTLIGDKWYRAEIKLQYPNKVILSPQFLSSKYVVVHTKRETINPPKKFFLFRWFLKKHTVVEIDVVEENPYIKNEKSRFVEIIK